MSNRILNILVLSFLVLFMTSCSDFENNMMKGMEDEGEEESEEDIDDGDIMSMLDGLGNPSNLKDIDSTFTFYEVMPDSVKTTIDNPELLKNVSMTINTNKSDMTAVMGLEVRYKSLDELEDIFGTLKAMGDNPDEEGNQMDSFKELIRDYEADLKNGIITLPEQDFSGDFGDNGMEDEEIDFENMSEEEAGMMQMMLGESGYVTTIHLPGNVISCDDTNAIIEGNTVTIKDSYMTLMKDGIFNARTIKYEVE